MQYNIYGTPYLPIEYPGKCIPNIVIPITDTRNIHPEDLFKGNQISSGGVLSAGNIIRVVK